MTYNLGATFSGPYDTDGVQTVFGFGFKIYAKTDAEVIYADAAGVETVVPSANWTVPATDFGKDAGGNITIPVPPVDGGTITIRLNPVKEQQTNLRNQGAYSPEAVERMADRLQMQILSLAEEVNRSIKSSISSGISSEDFLAVLQGYAAAAATSAAASEISNTSSQVAAITAAASAADAAASVADVQAIAGASMFPYQFNTSVIGADPATGKVLFNNATLASINLICISATTDGASNIREWIKTWDDSTSLPKGVITFKSIDNPANYIKFAMGNPVQDNTTWLSMPVTYISNNGTFASNELIGVSFAAAGNLGSVQIGAVVSGSPTVGSVLFVGAGNLLAQDNANLFWNDTTNALGIGTATPNANAILHLNSTTRGFKMPAMSKAQLDAIGVVVGDDGMMAYTTDLKAPWVFRSGIGWTSLCVNYSIADFSNPSKLDFFEATSNGTNKVTLTAPAALGSDITITTPSQTGTLALTSDPKTTLGTPQATTSGVSKTFTGIPSNAKKVTLFLQGVSTNGISDLVVQIGDSGGLETTGYATTAAYTFNASGTVAAQHTDGQHILAAGAAYSQGMKVVCELTDPILNTWHFTLSGGYSGAAGGTAHGGGYKSLSATLDRIALLTANGTDAFDAGVINISYEV